MKNPLPYPPPWQDAPTLCAHLCISEGTLDNWVRAGILPPARQRGGKRMWKWSEVQSDRHGRVYFIESDGLIKIGYSASIKQRLAGLAGSSAHEIKTLLIAYGTRRLEASLHFKFDHLRHHGEWFRKAPDLLAHIEQLREIAAP